MNISAQSASLSALIESGGERKIRFMSVVFMGLAHLVYLKEYVKGVFFALVEVVFLILSPGIVRAVINLLTLGSPQPDVPIKQRDNSIFMLIDGIIILSVIALFVVLYIISVRSAQSTYIEIVRTGQKPKISASLSKSLGRSFPIFGLAPGFIIVILFVIVPLVFSALVAFTNYSAPDHIPPNKTVDWVGLQNFRDILGGEASWSSGFIRVAFWTFVWAILATFTCYFGGLLVAVLLHESKIKLAPAFRIIFILPYAVPPVVSMLVWKNLLNGTFGTINRTLIELGIIRNVIPWLGDATLARFVCVVINLWAGFGYFMLLSMGTMTAIPKDVFEAARIDGANRRQMFRNITLPMVLYQTMPLIIMSFTFNINNFGAIFFLTGGQPAVADSTTTSAGGTDILVTWIYKLTITLLKYNYASVIAVIIFCVLAPFAIYNFRRTKSFKEGEV
ncbi:MAG: sugar ABC transporter permease [Spirochaetales bacterium]|nr:sugar ABC transporter permease [Spirochaetales bacterium]